MGQFGKKPLLLATIVSAMAASAPALAVSVPFWEYKLTLGFVAWESELSDTMDTPSTTPTKFLTPSNPVAGLIAPGTVPVGPVPQGVLPTVPAWDTLAWGGATVSDAPPAPCTDFDQCTLVETNPTTSDLVVTTNDGTVGFGGTAPLIETNGGAVDTGNIVHENRIVADTTIALEAATLQGRLDIAPVGTPGLPASAPSIFQNFNIEFVETMNMPGGGGCIPGTGAEPCADIFVLANADSLSDTFAIPGDPTGTIYTWSIQAIEAVSGNPIGTLSAEACEAALGMGNTDCVGFLTAEEANTRVNFELSISGVVPPRVPEPLTVALFGFGLAGMAATRRMRG